MFSSVVLFYTDIIGSARLSASQSFRIGREHVVYHVRGMDLGETTRLACFPRCCVLYRQHRASAPFGVAEC